MKKLLKDVVPEVRTIVKDLNGDVIILITSNIYGAGKSTLSMMLARAIWKPFSWERHMTHDVIDFLKLLKNKRVRVQVQDEGKRLGKRTDFMKKETRYLEDVLSETRKFNKVICINVGEMHRLFKWLSNERAVLWLHIFKRGQVLVFQARNYIMEGNKFGVTPKTFDNVKNEVDLYRRLLTLPSFRFDDDFPQYDPRLLSKEEFERYEGMAEDRTDTFIEDIVKELEQAKETAATRSVNYDEIVAQIEANLDDYLKTWGGRTFIDRTKIEADFDVSYTTSRKIRARVESGLPLE